MNTILTINELITKQYCEREGRKWMDNWINMCVSGWPEMVAKGITEGPEPIGD